ncbi:MAG: hypothetical protein PHH60_04325, partial [Candidatus Margulisbacteria bacterium]|nr:hypothetical protein [Candidatus Margulisiibacteriota bacterium]
MIIAIDPGREKCGLAVLDKEGRVLERKILPRKEAVPALPAYIAKYGLSTLVVGKGSFGKELEKEILKSDLSANVIFVSEKYSTLEARKLYWQENKPKGLWQLVP